MTLAYYGKSKQRRSRLALVAFFAVALAISAAGAWKLSGVDAASVTPVAFSGTNPTCGDVDNTLANGQTWLQVSTDTSPQTQAYLFPGVGTVNITVVAGNPLTFNWTSTFGIDAVIVKNGSVAHNVYVYATTTLASAESFGDNALQSLNNPDSISHVAFCYDPPLPTITKVATGGANPETTNGWAQFDITISNTGVGAVPRQVVLHDPNAVLVGILSNQSFCPVPVADGLECLIPAGQTVVLRVRQPYTNANYPDGNKHCVTGSVSNQATLALAASPTVVISTSALATVTLPADGEGCPPPTRTLRIQKVSPSGNHGGATFTGTITPGGSQTTFSVALSSSTTSSTVQSLTVSTAQQTVTEDTPPPGWTLNGYSVVADTAGTAVCPSTGYTGTTATVPATGNYLVCIQNTPRFLSVCKNFESNDDATVRTFGFKFDVKIGTVTTQYTVTDTEGGTNTCRSLIPIPGGPTADVTVTELSDRPSDWLGDAAGYPKNNRDPGGAVAHPGTDQSPTLIFFNREALALADPSVSKVKDTLGATAGGFAYWDITVNNQANTANSQTVFITDSAVFSAVVSGGACPSAVANTTDMTAGITCSVNAGATLTVRVRKAVRAPTCLLQTINNSATVKLSNVDGKSLGSVGGGSGTEYVIAGDPKLCTGTIIIEKIYLPAGVTPVVPAFFIGDAPAVVGSNSTSTGDHSVSETPPPGWKFVGVAATEGCDEAQPLLSEDFALHRAFEALTGTNEIAVFVTPGVTCTVTFTNELQTGKLFVKKLKDPTANQQVDNSQFNGTIGSQTWGPVGFNGTTPEIIVPAGSHAFAETGTQNGWTSVGYAFLANWNSLTACPAGKASYTSGLVPVVANQVTLVCVMNTKTALVLAPTIKKVKVDATHYTITINNGGSTPLTNIAVSDTFSQGGTTQKIDVVTWNPNDGLCSFGPNKLSFACTGLTVPAGGNLVINVFMTPYTNAQVCSDQIVTNTVKATFDTQGEITITPGFSNVATHTFPTARTDCTNGTIAVKKVRDPGAAFAADGTPFGGTIDGASWSGFITFGGATTPKSVNAGSHSVAETAPGGGWVLVGYQVFTNSSTTATCSTDIRSYSKSALNEVIVAVTTGQLTLVCVMNTRASPPPITQDCTTCAPLIVNTPALTSTPVRPTPTAPAATSVNTSTATNTPIPPTATKTTVDAVAGEKTPGPAAKSTPIAPSTGGGISGSGSSLTGVLALIGIAILGSGMALMAAGRRRTRG